MLKCGFSVIKETEVQTIITLLEKGRMGSELLLTARNCRPPGIQLSSVFLLFSGLGKQAYRD